MPGRGKRQAERREDAEQRHREARLDDLLAEDLAEGDGAAERLFRIHGAELGAQRIEEQVRIARRPDGERAVEGGNDREGNDHGRRRFGAPAAVLRVGDDPDDRDFRRARRVDERSRRSALQHAEPQARADGVLSRRPHLRRRFIDHRDPIAAPHFGGVEHPPAAQRNAERAQMVGGREIDDDALGVVWRLTGDGEG